jgi:hypothetical protein
MSDTYRFTTTEDDSYFERVLHETPEHVNFVLIQDRQTIHPGIFNSILFARTSTFVEVANEHPNVYFQGKTLGDWVLSVHDADNLANSRKDWVAFASAGMGRERRDYVLDRVNHDVNRFNNILNGKTVKVLVTTY